VPKWIPGASLLERLQRPLRSFTAMGVALGLLVLSAFPWHSAFLRTVGPASVFVVCGVPALISVANFSLDIHFLMTLAAFMSVFIGHASEGAMLLLLFGLSEEVEEWLANKAQSALDALGRISPEVAHRLPASAATIGDGQGAMDVKASELRAGDRILVRAGEVVPVDGEVLDGTSQVGMDHLTGEPLPVRVTKGNAVASGAVNMDGALLLLVRREASESTVQRIGRMAAEARATRPRLVTLLDSVGSKWSVTVMVTTILLAVVPLLFGSPVKETLYRATVWLVTASPCALFLATPLVYVSGLSIAARSGVLLKGARPLDGLATATGIAFDKTGTITSGMPSLESVQSVGKTSSDRETERGALLVASALARLSVHPVSRALAFAAPPGSRSAEVVDFHVEAGAGLYGTVSLPERGAVKAALGRPEFVARRLESYGARGIEVAAEIRKGAAARDEGPTAGRVTVALGILGRSSGEEDPDAVEAWQMEFVDHVKSSAPSVLRRIARRGPVYMLTGDRRVNASRVATRLGGEATFAGVFADLRPEDKLAKVQELDRALIEAESASTSLGARLTRALGVSTGGLVMVGDGINDAPALSAATVGISLTTQADGAIPSTAIDGADVLVLPRAGDSAGDADLHRVEWILHVARQARWLVTQNLCLALGSIIGASACTLFAGLPLWLGVLLHEGTTMLVALNSLRLLRIKLPRRLA